MSVPHRGIVSLLQRAADEREETARSEQWMRDAVNERLSVATEETELRSARAGFHRQQAQGEKERKAEETWRRRETEKEKRKEMARRDEQTTRQLQRIRHDEDKENRLKQKILANSMELRDLERALRESYSKKEQKAQIAERKLRDMQEARRLAEISARLEADDRKAVETEKRKQKDKVLDRLKYQEQLEMQLDEMEARKQEAYEQLLREKAVIDDIARQIQEEDEREWRIKMERKGEMRKFIAEFLEERESWRREREVEIAEENRKIQEYLTEKTEREREETERKKTARVEEERIVETLAKRLLEKRAEEEEVREMTIELAEAKREEQVRMEERKHFERQLRKKLQIDRDRREEARRKMERKVTEKEEEEEFRKIMLRKFAEDAKLEQLNADRRRFKQMEHRRAVERLIEDRRRSALEAKHDERRIFEEQMEEERQRRLIVEEERQRILQEHAQRLLGFLPRGILKASDVAKLNPEVRVKFQEPRRDGSDEEENQDDWTLPKRKFVGGKFQ